MTEPQCICEFDDECHGLGSVECAGCGGDFCVCALCWGWGEMPCEGCQYCEHWWDDD